MTSVRQAAVAGTFYPNDRNELDAAVQYYLLQATPNVGAAPKAIIAPHAGYIYSGPMAAEAYATLRSARDVIRRVILLGPCHRVALQGLGLPSVDFFHTPLGDIPIDKIATKKILSLAQVQTFDATHELEHSLEVHLPFLQVVLDDFTLIPMVVGSASAEQVAEVLDELWGGPETIIVISSDLSHYLDYDTAQKLDASTSIAIENFNFADIKREQACGRIPMSGLLSVAKHRGMRVETLGICNSGDTAGSKDKVVGYGSWAFWEADETSNDFTNDTKVLLDKYGVQLLHLAADSLQYGLAHGLPLKVNLDGGPPELSAPGACFVTLKSEGKLRGCIGSAIAHRPLAEDVASRGFDAAFKDHRFPNLTEVELDGLELSLSVLSPQSLMNVANEEDLLSQLRPRIDGLVIEDKGKRALFLPSVWEQLPDARLFLTHLKQKAGLGSASMSSSLKAWRFISEEISAADLPDGEDLWKSKIYD
jgi:AmmeMemoRadiSam system protein B/AmmeMemoRadiSam system protein A